MDKQQIKDEAIKYCSRLDFTDDENLNEKGREKVRDWLKQDFIAGAEWMQEQLRLSSVSQQRELLYAVCDKLAEAIHKHPLPPSLKSAIINEVLANNCC